MAKPKNFEQLVRQHHAAVYRAALRICRQEHLAEDISQQVFLRVLDGRESVEQARDPAALLCWLARRLACNALRSIRRGDQLSAQLATESVMSEPKTPQPGQAAVDAEQAEILRRSLDALEDAERIPVLLNCQEGLSLAAVGELLELPRSTVHDRVQRGLEKLRRLLQGSGLALAPAQIEAGLATLPAAPVPAGLEASLLALQGKGLLLGLGLTRLLAAGLLLGGGAAVWLADPFAWRQAAAPERVSAGGAAAASPASDPDGSRPESRQALPRGKATAAPVLAQVQGRILDLDGQPVPGVRVLVESSRGGKAAAIAAEARSDAAGGFSLQLAPEREAERFSILVLQKGQRRYQAPEFVLRRGENPPPQEIRLPRSAGAQRDRFELRVALRDAQGQPLVGAAVHLHSVHGPDQPSARTLVPTLSNPRLDARSDALGQVRFEDTVLGDKVLIVDARAIGGSYLRRDFVQRTGGFRDLRCALPAARELRGRVRLLAGAKAAGFALRLTDEESGVQTFPRSNNAADFHFVGLDAGRYTLEVRAPGCSSAVLPGLRAGQPAIEVQLKSAADPRDLGQHQAEIHGLLLDPEGRELPAREFDIRHHPLHPGASSLIHDRVAARPVLQRISSGFGQNESAPLPPGPGFHCVDMPAGPRALSVAHYGYATEVLLVDMAAAEIRAGQRIRLRRGARLRGRVFDAAGAALEGATVMVLGFGPQAEANLRVWDANTRGAVRESRYPSLVAARAQTDATGRFDLRRVPCGAKLRLVAMHGDHAPRSSAAMVLAEAELRELPALHMQRR